MNVDGWVENYEDECSVQNDVILGDGERRLIQPFSANVNREIRSERRQKLIQVGGHHRIGRSYPPEFNLTFKYLLGVPI